MARLSRSARNWARHTARREACLSQAKDLFHELLQQHALVPTTLYRFWEGENELDGDPVEVVDRGGLRLTAEEPNDCGHSFSITIGTSYPGGPMNHGEDRVTLSYDTDPWGRGENRLSQYGEWHLSRGRTAGSSALLSEIDLGLGLLLRNDPDGHSLHVPFGVDMYKHDPRSPFFTSLLDRMLRHFSLAK